MVYKIDGMTKDYIWGGQRLRGYGYPGERIAEAWALSFHPDGMSTTDGAPVSTALPRERWGENCRAFEQFPVLIKLIDAADNLSVQVHPSDDYALRHEGQYGKTEMWHIVDATDDAYIYLGFNRNVTKEQFVTALNNKTLCDLLNKVPVKPNQTYFVPSGIIHAIGGGVTLIEIQQNSDLTYRVYDYDRLGADGKPRELHINKALKVLNFGKYVIPDTSRNGLLGKCKYFAAYRYQGEQTLTFKESFASVTTLQGSIQVNGVELQRGETVFVSAGTQLNITGCGTYCLVTVEK